ncbi:auxin-responsive protein saur50 [Fagus crenata]
MGGERGVDLRHMYFLSSGPPPLNQEFTSAKPGDHCKVRKGSNGILGSIMGNLQKRFSLFNGVKQGYFVVVATKGWKPERFVVELGYLNNPGGSPCNSLST